LRKERFGLFLREGFCATFARDAFLFSEIHANDSIPKR
jgi:hypothetical protein